VIAFLPSLGFQEMVILVIIGLLLYGRNLPEAGRALGKVAAQFRRGFQEFKDQLDREGDLRDMKKTLQNTAQELKRVADVPRANVDPTRMLRDLTNEALSSPIPQPPIAESPSQSAAESEATYAPTTKPATEPPA
jgi:sec-independent protein translocase protein TatA